MTFDISERDWQEFHEIQHFVTRADNQEVSALFSTDLTRKTTHSYLENTLMIS